MGLGLGLGFRVRVRVRVRTRRTAAVFTVSRWPPALRAPPSVTVAPARWTL